MYNNNMKLILSHEIMIYWNLLFRIEFDLLNFEIRYNNFFQMCYKKFNSLSL